jgi:hypothetical protein
VGSAFDGTEGSVMKPWVYKHGSKWECEYRGAVWQFETWWQALNCALILSTGQVPWMFPSHISRAA